MKNPGPCFATYVPIPVFVASYQRPAIRAFREACLIIHHLFAFVILLQQRYELHDVGVLSLRGNERDGGGRRVKVDNRFTYVSIKLVAGPVETEDQGAIVVRFGNNLVVPLTSRDGCRRFCEFSVGAGGVDHAGCNRGHYGRRGESSSVVVVVRRERLRTLSVVGSHRITRPKSNMFDESGRRLLVRLGSIFEFELEAQPVATRA